MQIIEVSALEFDNYDFSSHIFNKSKFIEQNKHKCDEVRYLIFKDSKVRFGMPIGIRGNIVKSPFSAPFGGLSYKNNDTKHNMFFEAIIALNDYIKQQDFSALELFLPPIFYDVENHAKLVTALLMNNYKIDFVDINHSFNLNNFTENYLDFIQYNAKKSLNIAISKQLEFNICSPTKQKLDAYNIIKQNRHERGFPLKLTFEDILGTIEFVKSFFFIVSLPNETDIASAICYEIQEGVIQVIYWGNLTQYNEYKPINFLSYKLFEYFKSLDYNIVDIGPSSEGGIVNFGLSEFKESIGCDRHLKLHLSM